MKPARVNKQAIKQQAGSQVNKQPASCPPTRALAQAFKQQADLLLAFVLPIAILLATFAALQVYPFGERSVNNLDLYHQYLPIMSELQRIIHEGGSIFYSFNAGLGTNFYALSTYQNASPITWLFLALFSEEHIVLCAVCMILFKIGLIAVSMYYYLKRTSTKQALTNQDRALKLALATLFSLCGYVVGYYTNLMWLDSIILLPLCVLGLRQVVDGKSGTLYAAALALLLFTNYYIGAMVCLFLVLYYLAYFFSDATTSRPPFVRTTLRLAGLTALAGVMAAVVLVPTVFALQKTADFTTVGAGTTGLFYLPIGEHIRQLLPCSYVTIIDGPPNLYAGLISLILLVLFALQHGISMRTRIARIALIAIVFASTNIVPLDYVWHFFHAPNSFPARYSFVLAFLLVETAVGLLDHTTAFKARDLALALGVCLVLYAFALLGEKHFELDTGFMLVSGGILLILYAFVLLVMRDEQGKLRTGFLAVVILFEVALVGFRGIGAGNIVQDNDYGIHRAEVAQLVATAESRTPFCRIELLGTDNSMPPYVYGYKGTSIFASSVPQSTYDTLNTYLNRSEIKLNQFIYKDIDPAADSLLNIRYYISLAGSLDKPGLREVAQVNGCYLYENPYQTAIGFMLPSGASAPVYAEGTNKFAVESMAGNQLAGSINVAEPGTLFISIPYDSGWRVEVDGVAIPDFQQVEGFISFELGQGAHDVQMRYIPEGFVTGAFLSILGLIVWVVYAWRKS